MQWAALHHSRGKDRNVYKTKQGKLARSHQGCPHTRAKKEFPCNKLVYFVTRGTSLHCIHQVSGKPHISISWLQSHSVLSDLLPLYILLVILTENGKYTSHMAYLFTRDMWHCFPFCSSSIPQHNWLLSLKVNFSITSASHLFNLTSSQTNIFVASVLATLTLIPLKPGNSCSTQSYWWLWTKQPKACWGQGDQEYWILQIKGDKYFSFPTGKLCIPPERQSNIPIWECSLFTDSLQWIQRPSWGASVKMPPVPWEESNPLLLVLL